jgi:hypothetical protein
LRAYLALTIELQTTSISTGGISRRNKSRLFVYDIHNYMNKKYCGPFTNSGRVDWEHVEHLVNVAVYNFRDLPRAWRGVTPPLGLEASRMYSAPALASQDIDWAGVEGWCWIALHVHKDSSSMVGTWRRYVFSLDYRLVESTVFCQNGEITHEALSGI